MLARTATSVSDSCARSHSSIRTNMLVMTMTMTMTILTLTIS